MTRHYWLILLAFIATQLSPLIILPLVHAAGWTSSAEELQGMSLFIGFTIGFLVISWIAYRAEPNPALSKNKTGPAMTIVWIFLGIFLAFFSQYIAIIIETYVFGIEAGSENTEDIVAMATAYLPMILVVAILVPVTEEIVFRMVIFGALFKRFGFWIAALTSGLIFAVVHWDFEHLLLYLSMGLAFAFLYVKTKRIIVPIMAHVGINSTVMLVQVLFREDIEEFLERMEEAEQTVQAILGGLFL